jgi:hypothetical protein
VNLLTIVALVLSATAPGQNTERAVCLTTAYPGVICDFRDNQVVWCDGTPMPWDDGKQKPHQALLNAPDLEDQFTYRYSTTHPPGENQDPGRIRYAPFFAKLYGDSRLQVRRALKRVRWLPARGRKSVRIHSRAAEPLAAVAAELAALPRRFKKYLRKPPQTFVWRHVRGTKRLSAHSYGIALDLALPFADYWRWRGVHRYRNRIPMEIVRIFEKHGFIWGGRWYHFDTMHFEYRPELLVEPCREP